MEIVVVFISMLLAAGAQAERDQIRYDIMNAEVRIATEISDISQEIEWLEETLWGLSGSHASQAAVDEVRHEKLTQQINNLHDRLDSLKGRTDYLDDKIGILHP
jgi:predicted  nucleic acid-binding Zn-ribbon protein